MLLAKSMSAEELARELILCLSTELGITGDRLIASMHDRVSVNIASYPGSRWAGERESLVFTVCACA